MVVNILDSVEFVLAIEESSKPLKKISFKKIDDHKFLIKQYKKDETSTIVPISTRKNSFPFSNSYKFNSLLDSHKHDASDVQEKPFSSISLQENNFSIGEMLHNTKSDLMHTKSDKYKSSDLKESFPKWNQMEIEQSIDEKMKKSQIFDKFVAYNEEETQFI